MNTLRTACCWLLPGSETTKRRFEPWNVAWARQDQPLSWSGFFFPLWISETWMQTCVRRRVEKLLWPQQHSSALSTDSPGINRLLGAFIHLRAEEYNLNAAQCGRRFITKAAGRMCISFDFKAKKNRKQSEADGAADCLTMMRSRWSKDEP